MDLDDDELKATRILNGVDKVENRCKFCGDIIEQPKRGRKRTCCRKPECLKKQNAEISRNITGKLKITVTRKNSKIYN